MLYWSLRTLSEFYHNEFDVIVFYDSDIKDLKFENIHINNYNIINDFPFVKFIKLDFISWHKDKEEPFKTQLIPWMFKWFCLERVFNLGYENILYLDVDTVFYRDPIEIFNSLNEKSPSVYVNNGVRTHLLSKRNVRDGLGINSGQFYLSNISISNFYNLYYKFRVELYNESSNQFDKYFSEQWAGLLVFNQCKLNIKILPPELVKRANFIKTPCVFHYGHQKVAHKILPEYLHTKSIEKQIQNL